MGTMSKERRPLEGAVIHINKNRNTPIRPRPMVQYNSARLDPSAPPATCLVPVRIGKMQWPSVAIRYQRRSAFRFDYERGKGGIFRILYRIIRRLFHAESHRYAPTFFWRLLSRIGVDDIRLTPSLDGLISHDYLYLRPYFGRNYIGSLFQKRLITV